MSLFLLDLGKPVVFCHIPKTGGTSIRQECQMSEERLYTIDPKWEDLPCFGFIRDPYDRIESLWRDFKYQRGLTTLGFEAFLLYACSGDKQTIDDSTTAAHHAAPISHPVHGFQHVDFIGRYTHLQEDFDFFCGMHGLESFELPLYRSSEGHPRAERTLTSNVWISQHYEDDYRAFDFEDPCAPRKED